MTGIKERHSRDFKLKVAIEALSGAKTLAQIASEFGIHPTQIKRWKAGALEAMNERFSSRPPKKREEAIEGQLYEEIGRLKVENDFLSGKLKR